MINIFLLNKSHTPLADDVSEILENIALKLKSDKSFNLECSIDEADAIIIQESYSYKDFRYIKKLKNDPIFQKYAHKIFTINKDTCATGLLKGLYYSLPKRRFNPSLYANIPYFSRYNALIFQDHTTVTPNFLACWRGNLKSHKVRKKIVNLFRNDLAFNIQTTDSWYDHSSEENELYINALRNAKFSLCPAGLAANTRRIYESMAMGKCPVIIADEYVRPVGPDWDSFSIVVAEKNIKNLKDILENHASSYACRGEKAYEAWQRFFSPAALSNYYATQLIKLITSVKRTSPKEEFQRWDSFSLRYKNNWTFFQRAVKKLNKTAYSLCKIAFPIKWPIINARFTASLKLWIKQSN